MRQLSETDAPTGLFNRRKLMAELDRRYEVFRRYGSPTSVLIFDVDDFKGINDEYGHQAGDQAIITIARPCRDTLRRGDFLARLGGDEFVILLPDTSADLAAPILENLRRHVVTALCQHGVLARQPTLSGGLSEFFPEDGSSEPALNRADAALYRAKRAGRDKIVCG